MPKRFHTFWLVMLLVVHLAGILNHFPIKLLDAEMPPVGGDTSRYFATTASAAYTGRIWGYDPLNLAGYPHGLWNSMGKKGFEVAHQLMPAMPLSVLFYWTYVLVSFIAPLIAWWGGRKWVQLPSSPNASGNRVLLLAVILCAWHLSTWVSYFWTYGSLFYSASACLLVPMVTLVWEMSEDRNRKLWLKAVGLGLLASAVFYGHTVLLIPALLPILFVLGLRWRKAMVQQWLALAVSGIVCLTLILPWLIPLLQHREYVLAQPHGPWFVGKLKWLIINLLTDRFAGQVYDRNFLLHLILAFGLLGAGVMWLKRECLAVVLGIAALLCLIFTGIGQFCEFTRGMQPYRFFVPATLFMVIPATIGIAWAWDVFRSSNARVKVLCLLFICLLIPQGIPYLLDQKEVMPRGVTDQQAKVIEAVRALPASGRILCDEMTIGHLIPHLTGRGVLGGLSAQAFLEHRFAGITEASEMFDWHTYYYQEDDMRPYFEQYAVAYAIFSKPDQLEFAERSPGLLQEIRQIGDIHIFQVIQQASYVKGAEAVAISPEKLKVFGVTGSEVEIRFHYANWLRADQGVSLKPEHKLRDPVPFIHATIPAGVTSFTVYLQPQ